MADIKILHQWEISIDKEIEETVPEIRDGQEIKVTKKVIKPVITKMALKHPSRRELRNAELFYGTEYNRFFNMGFLPRSILINKHLDLTGGVLSHTERTRIEKLSEKYVELEGDLVRSINATDDIVKKIQGDLASIRTEISNLNAANESVFSQTAEVKAQSQLGQWLAFNLVYIEKGGKWEPYFAGDTFDKKEEYMWNLEETNDEFYTKSIQKILTYVHFFNMGANKPEQFKLIDEELKKQLESKSQEEPAPVVS